MASRGDSCIRTVDLAGYAEDLVTQGETREILERWRTGSLRLVSLDLSKVDSLPMKFFRRYIRWPNSVSNSVRGKILAAIVDSKGCILSSILNHDSLR